MNRFVQLVVVATWLVTLVNGGPVILRDVNDLEDGGEEELLAEDEIDLSSVGMAIYGNPDEAVGALVDTYDPETALVNVEELGTYAEGDMLITRPAGRNGMADVSTRWPGGVVPFVISGNFQAKDMQLIEDAFNEYHSKTCVRFKPRMGEKDFISIESSQSGCWSSVGRIGGKQEVNLQMPGCTTKVGTIVHELMHALGFMHEQNRSERDDWVTIMTQNIQRGTENNFAKASSRTTTAFGVQYDYGSVMHYSTNAFSSNGKPTIVAKRSTNGAKMGQREGFSASDVEKINRMYGCADGSIGTGPPISLPFPVPPPFNGIGSGGAFPTGPYPNVGPFYPGYGYYPSGPGGPQPYYPGYGGGGGGGGYGYPQGPYPAVGPYGYGPYYPYDEKDSELFDLVQENHMK